MAEVTTSFDNNKQGHREGTAQYTDTFSVTEFDCLEKGGCGIEIFTFTFVCHISALPEYCHDN